MTAQLDELCWPLDRSAEAMEALASASGLGQRLGPSPKGRVGCDGALPRAPAPLDEKSLPAWVDGVAGWLGIEAEPIHLAYGDLERILRDAAPALLVRPSVSSGPPVSAPLLVLTGADRRGRRVRLLGPDLDERWIPLETLRAALGRPLEAPLEGELDRLLGDAGVPARRQPRVRRALFAERLAARTAGVGFLLRHHPGLGFRRAARKAGLGTQVGLLVLVHAVEYALALAGWWMIGRGALSGRLDRGWIVAWLILLFTLIPFRLLSTWLAGRFAVGAGALIKERLLVGALQLDPETIRHQGAGQLLGQVIESGAIEQLATGGALLALVALLELGFAGLVLCAGPGGVWHLLLLAAWTGASGALTWRYFRRRRAWTEGRLAMTHDLVERMVGHRTRLQQEDAERWHDDEDQALERYLGGSRAMDRTGTLMSGLLPRGWLVLGILGLGPAFAAGGPEQAMGVAIGLGGILLAYRALRKLGVSLSQLVGAAIAWEKVAPLFAASARVETPGSPAHTVAHAPAADGRLLLEAHDLEFRYRDRGEAVLRGCSLEVRVGDRVLLEGPSGGGKSTLASLLVGLRLPGSGLLLLGGLDRQTLGLSGWRKRVVAAPQFHENHIFAGTFAFNLLIGRSWPPETGDLEEAEAICRELDLGPLIARMPAGLLQVVGETGWQLSHGERSRLYIARALLQNADLIVLDESFGALDPETLQRSLECVLKRARTVIIIAHP